MNDLHDFIEQSRKSITIDIVKNLHNQSAGAIAARMIKEHAGLDELAGFIKSEKDKIDIFTAFKIPEQNKTSLIRKLEALKKEKEIVFSSYDEILITGKSKRKTAVRVILLFKQSSPEKMLQIFYFTMMQTETEKNFHVKNFPQHTQVLPITLINSR